MGTAATGDDARESAARIYREEGRRIFASLVRLVGDFDLAEEALQDAFAAALEQWPRDGAPANPRAWLVSAGRFKAIDALRRRGLLERAAPDLAARAARDGAAAEDWDERQFRDDHLRLIFTCCHPALPAAVQVAMTLREVCGLTTEEIARAFLSAPAAVAQRIVRGKAKIRAAGIPYAVPAMADLPERLDAVLAVIYLVFNEGYSASAGADHTRPDLSGEAIRLGRVLLELLPDPEVIGLLALMLLHESRRAARTDADGDIVVLEDQDRGRWDRALILEGRTLALRALSTRRFGAYTLQAAIAAVHAEAPTARATDWAQIVALYDALHRADPSPVVALNRAVAVAMRDGPEAALPAIEALIAPGGLGEYHLAHAARADLCRRLGRAEEARAAYARALELARQEPERRFLRRRIAELGRP